MENEVGIFNSFLKMFSIQDLNNLGGQPCGGLHREFGLEINNSEKIHFYVI